MALSVTPLSSPLGAKMVEETSANATSRNNVTGAPGSIHMVEYDNTPNAQACFLKLYNDAAPVVGTTASDLKIPIPANARRSIAIPQGLGGFTAAISFAVTTGKADTDTVSPAGAVIVRLVTS